MFSVYLRRDKAQSWAWFHYRKWCIKSPLLQYELYQTFLKHPPLSRRIKNPATNKPQQLSKIFHFDLSILPTFSVLNGQCVMNRRWMLWLNMQWVCKAVIQNILLSVSLRNYVCDSLNSGALATEGYRKFGSPLQSALPSNSTLFSYVLRPHFWQHRRCARLTESWVYALQTCQISLV